MQLVFRTDAAPRVPLVTLSSTRLSPISFAVTQTTVGVEAAVVAESGHPIAGNVKTMLSRKLPIVGIFAADESD